MDYNIKRLADCIAEAMGKGDGEKHINICNLVGIGHKTIYSWRNPHSGERSPYQFIVDLFSAQQAMGISRAVALRPILWVCEQVGLIAFPAPQVDGTGDEVYREFVRTSKELGDVATELEKALDPKGKGGARITPREATPLLKEIDEHIRAAAALKEIIKAKTREAE